jgi:hypothetical protein
LDWKKVAYYELVKHQAREVDGVEREEGDGEVRMRGMHK